MELPEWLRAPRQSSMALLQFLPSSSVTSRIEQFEHLTSISESRQSSSNGRMLGMSSMSSSFSVPVLASSVSVTRPFSVPVHTCVQCVESRQGIHFDDTSSESDSPSKAFLLLFGLFGKILTKFISKDFPLIHLVCIKHQT